ncbi:MAG: hypothetical protein HC803_08380 [Saprospiraceae bacterium]|nr:hypothetical protein [Saprospiraceae bacterium]
MLSAFANPKVRGTMTAEDEIIDEIQGYSRKIENLTESLEAKNKVLEENAKVLEQGILQMLKFNIPIADIAKSFNLSEAEVLKLKNKNEPKS